MYIGVIGLGSVGERHVRNLQKLYPRASIDILTQRTKWNKANKNTHLIKSEKDFFTHNHDVYFVTNETNKHIETVAKCLVKKPKGIFVEKPLSHDLKNIEKIKTQAQRQKTVFVVGYNLQFFTPLLTLKRLLKQKTVGKVFSLRVFVGQDLRNWRTSDYRTSYSSDQKRGGGVVLDLIHDLNYPGWLLDETLKYVSGASGRISNLEIDSEDIAEGIFVSESGVAVSVHQDYLAVPGGRSCEVMGDKGTIRWEWLFGPKGYNRIYIHKAKGSRVLKTEVPDKNSMYVNEVRAFLKHVQDKDAYSNLSEAIIDMKNALMLRARPLSSKK